MEVAILIAGLSVYFVATLIYLRGAYRSAPLWCWSSIILPPVALVFYVIHWRRSWQLFTLHTAGLALLVLGLVLFARVNPLALEDTPFDGLRAAVAPASYARPKDAAVEQFADIKDVSPYIGRIDGVIGGKLNNETFYINHVSLRDGVLRFKKGQGLFAQNEIAIFLDLELQSIDRHWEFTVNPSTQQPPMVHVSYHDARTGRTHTDIYDGGYWLELHLSDRRLNEISGFVRLLLPGGSKDFLAGNFESFTSELRYDDNDIDRFYDSKDTVEFVAKSHLKAKFKRAVRNVKFIETNLLAHLAQPVANTIAELELTDDSLHSISLELFKGQSGWTVDTSSTDDLKVALSKFHEEPPGAGEPVIVSSFEIYSGTNYEKLIGKRLQVTSTSGSIRSGKLKSVENAQLEISAPLADGYVSYHVPKRMIGEIVVLN